MIGPFHFDWAHRSDPYSSRASATSFSISSPRPSRAISSSKVIRDAVN